MKLGRRCPGVPFRHLLLLLLLQPIETSVVVDVVAENPNLNALAGAITRADAGLVGPLSDPITFFAPSDAAFQAAPGLVAMYMTKPEWIAHLTYLLRYHITPGIVMAADLTDGMEITTLAKSPLATPVVASVSETAITLSGEAFMDSTVVQADLFATMSGVVHVVDKVFIPPALLDTHTMLDTARLIPGAEQLALLVEVTNSVDIFTNQIITVFGPSDAAFNAVPPDVTATAVADNLFKVILENHVVPGVWPTALFTDGLELTTLAGDTLTVSVEANLYKINGATIEQFDSVASNGVVHLIDTVLLPASLQVPEPPTEPAGNIFSKPNDGEVVGGGSPDGASDDNNSTDSTLLNNSTAGTTSNGGEGGDGGAGGPMINDNSTSPSDGDDGNNATNDKIEDWCQYDSDCAERCGDAIQAADQCFLLTSAADASEDYENCVNCLTRGVPAGTTTANDENGNSSMGGDSLFEPGEMTPVQYKERGCAHVPSCSNACGDACFETVTKVAKCAWKCEDDDTATLTNEAICGDGSECALRCEDKLSAMNQCFFEKTQDQPGDFGACFVCISLEEASISALESGAMTPQEYNEQTCLKLPECADACGICFGSITDLTQCAWGCDAAPPTSGGGGSSSEVKCQDGSECSERCEDKFSAFEECFGGDKEELQICLACIQLEQLDNDLDAGNIGRDEYREKICEHAGTCEPSCGSCFGAVKEIGTCAFVCSFETPPSGGSSNTTTTSNNSTASDCIDNTTVLFDYMEAKEPSQYEEYILCPNTVFELGVIPDQAANCCIDGMAPIAARANSKVKCGADGKLSNNCTIVGGQFQIISSFYTYFENSNNNIQFEGLTLKGSTFASLILENAGDIVFKECLFAEHKAIAPVITAYNGPVDVRRLHESIEDFENMGARERMFYAMNEQARKLQGEKSIHDELEPHQRQSHEEYRTGHRELQASQTVRQKTTFENCTFKDNERGQGGQEKNAVITVEGIADDLVLRNCLFENNQYDVKGYNVEFVTPGHTFEITDTCFLDNNLSGPGAVVMPDATILTKNIGNYASYDYYLQCRFVAVVNYTHTTCIDSTETVCSITGTSGENDSMAPAPTPGDGNTTTISDNTTTISDNNTVSAPENILHIEVTCQDGSDCATRCNDKISTMDLCFSNKTDDLPGEYEKCVDCIRLGEEGLGLLLAGQLTPDQYKERGCMNAPSCSDVCGVCFGKMEELVQCAWGCENSTSESPETGGDGGNGDDGTQNSTSSSNGEGGGGGGSGSGMSNSTSTSDGDDSATEVKCQDGSECSQRCEDKFAVFEGCFSGSTEELQACIGCIQSEQLDKDLDSGEISSGDYRVKVCEQASTCESFCGSCFGVVKEAAKCAFACNFFSQNVAIILDGVFRLMNDLEIELYVEAMQTFLSETDPTAKVYFVSQELLRDRRHHKRQLQSSSLEVTTRIDSEQQENPGLAAFKEISNNFPNFVNILRDQDQEIFYSVSGVTAKKPDIPPAPTPPPSPPPSSSSDSGNTLFLVVGALLFIISVSMATFFCIKIKRIMDSEGNFLQQEQHPRGTDGYYQARTGDQDEDNGGYYARSNDSRYEYNEPDERREAFVVEDQGYRESRYNDYDVADERNAEVFTNEYHGPRASTNEHHAPDEQREALNDEGQGPSRESSYYNAYDVAGERNPEVFTNEYHEPGDDAGEDPQTFTGADHTPSNFQYDDNGNDDEDPEAFTDENQRGPTYNGYDDADGENFNDQDSSHSDSSFDESPRGFAVGRYM